MELRKSGTEGERAEDGISNLELRRSGTEGKEAADGFFTWKSGIQEQKGTDSLIWNSGNQETERGGGKLIGVWS
jgi:hypothetical protein